MTNSPKTIYLKDYKVPPFLIDKVELEFHLEEEFTTVKSKLTMRQNSSSSDSSLKLMGEELELQSIALNGKSLSPAQYEITEHSLTIFSVPKEFTLEIQTRNKPQENTSLSGLYKSSGNFCTQCEAQGFRRITYFLDRPDIMARYTTKIIANEKNYPVLLSNGNLIASGKLDNDKHWAAWEDPFHKPSYLFALVAGNLEYLEDFFVTKSNRRVTLRIYTEKGNRDKCLHAMQAVKKAMRWDEEKFGREYDLDIYMIVAVSDFNMGAMENKGLNIFNTQYILAKPEMATDLDFIHVESVIAHEYFHNWTGNRITCRDWFQLSLKEGLTIFRDQSFTADTTSATVARIRDVNALRTSQFPEDAGPLAHPVRPDSYIEINNFYTSTVYNKGAEVIRMIQTLMGQTLFRRGMDLYFERFDGQAVTIEDFVKAHEDASGIDLTQFRLWYAQAGTPVLDVKGDYDEAAHTYTLHVKQTCPPTPDQPHKKPMHIPLLAGLLDNSGKEIANQLLQIKDHENQFTFEGITSQPIPSLLRNFSAPAKVKYPYSDIELALLFKHDTDLFNRWEAGQKYAVNLILGLIEDYQQQKTLKVSERFIDVFKHLLLNAQNDKWLLSEMLTLPSEKYIAEHMTVIDVDAIHAAREYVLQEIATQLKNLFEKIHLELHDDKPYQFSMEAVGKRYLKNLCLFYLMILPDQNIHKSIGMRQFNSALAYNMTDTMAALKALVNVEGRERAEALSDFYAKWRDDALVVDKWFALQAGSKLPGTLQHVKELTRHEAFDIKNPNKVYSLIGAFGNNAIHFHAKNGEGYKFLAEIVLQLNALNPQIAARMIKPLTTWKRYDSARQQLMREQLEILSKNPKLSADVFELVTKSL
ncbi:MAG TPA: aminopeptidase N [Gammaproteobacteria bacterium]|nr:aminopeptidase N [Gammaproteobacteria bacterium]